MTEPEKTTPDLDVGVQADGTETETPADTPASEAPSETEAHGLAPVPPTPDAEIEALKAERAELRDQLLRRRAEFENFRKRVERDRDLATTEAMAALFREVLPTLDNLERALRADAEDLTLRQGVEMIHRELLSLLERHGVTVEDPTGTHFEPASQQALLHEESPDAPPETVVEVFRKSYHFRGRLLRPALVKVSKAVNPAASDDTEQVQ